MQYVSCKHVKVLLDTRSEFFLECTIGLYEMRVHNNSSFPSSVFMSGGGHNEDVDMMTVRYKEKGEEIIYV